jgi:hypothetical protein
MSSRQSIMVVEVGRFSSFTAVASLASILQNNSNTIFSLPRFRAKNGASAAVVFCQYSVCISYMWIWGAGGGGVKGAPAENVLPPTHTRPKFKFRTPSPNLYWKKEKWILPLPSPYIFGPTPWEAPSQKAYIWEPVH